MLKIVIQNHTKSHEKVSTFVGDSTYMNAPPTHRSPLQSNHQTSMTSEEALKTKLAFEKFALTHGVHIKHYHADNLFTKSIEDKGHTISFCGVGTHHQNGIAEKRIVDLQRRETTLITTCTEKMARCNQYSSVDLCHQSSK
jgi:hypothetical protein